MLHRFAWYGLYLASTEATSFKLVNLEKERIGPVLWWKAWPCCGKEGVFRVKIALMIGQQYPLRQNARRIRHDTGSPPEPKSPIFWLAKKNNSQTSYL